MLAACAVWLWLVLLALLQWRLPLRSVLRGYGVAFAIAALSLCALTGAAFYQTRLLRVAIVIANEATVRNGPLTESKTAFTAHDGAELRVLDQKDEWLEVSAGPRETGWLRRDEVLMPQ